jgi:hypothetical protein
MRLTFLPRLAAALPIVAVAGCFPLAANYIHLDIRPVEPRGRIVRTDGSAPAEIAFGLARRDEALAPGAIPVPPHGNAWHRFVFTGLAPIDFRGRLELPPMVVDGVTVPVPAFSFEVRVWAGIAPLNC